MMGMITLNIYAQLSWTLQTKLALPLKIYIYHRQTLPPVFQIHISNIFTGHHMENEILEIIDTIETIELSDGKAKETGDLEDTFFLEAMQSEKVLGDVIENPFLLSERKIQHH